MSEPIVESIIRKAARKSIDEQKAFEFMMWSLREFPDPGWQAKCKKIFSEELKKTPLKD